MSQARTVRHTKHSEISLADLLREVGPFAVVGIVGAIALLLIFAKLSEEVFSHEITGIDNSVSLWLHNFANPGLDALFRWLSTYIGVVGVVALSIVSFVALLWRKHPYEAWRLALVTIGGLVINQVLKLLFHRSRPDLWSGSHFAGFSFPSGHATMSFCLFGMLIWLSWRYVGSQAARVACTILLAVVILLVGLSRIYLGAHYLSDVVAGYLSAGFWLVAVLSGTDIYARLRGERRSAQPGQPN